MYTVLVVVHVLVAAGLIGLVLVQHGKGADAGAAFGSGASGTVFGSRGSANFLTKTTAWLAFAFFAISLALAYLIHGRVGGGSVTDQIVEPPAVQVPAAGGPAPAAEVPAVPAAPVVPEAGPAAGAAKPAQAPAEAGKAPAPKVPD